MNRRIYHVDPYGRDKFEELWLASRHPEDDY
jgi:hypothetical protein